MAHTDEQLEDEARSTFRRLGMEHVKKHDQMTVIVKLKAMFPGFNYQRVKDDELPEAYAQWDGDARLIKMRDSVFREMQGNSSRARMTMWEEIAHMLLGHRGVLNRSIGKTISEQTIRRVIAQEREAKRFAAVLAAPEYQLPDELTVDYLCDEHGLSVAAAIIRLEEVARLRRRRSGELRPLPSITADFLAEAARRGVPIKTKT